MVGPEQPLVEGITETLNKEGISVFGPSRKAALIEGSKAFSKDFMKRNNIPTAKYEVFTEFESALQYVSSIDFPIVVKVCLNFLCRDQKQGLRTRCWKRSDIT